eukprot:731884_1
MACHSSSEYANDHITSQFVPFAAYAKMFRQSKSPPRSIIPKQISTDERRISPSEHCYKQANKCIKLILFVTKLLINNDTNRNITINVYIVLWIMHSPSTIDGILWYVRTAYEIQEHQGFVVNQTD